MPDAAISADESPVLPDLLSACTEAQRSVENFVETARARVAAMVSVDGRVNGGRLND